MSSKITFYLMTYKGYWVLNEFLKTFDSSVIDAVILSKDNNVKNDYYADIIQLCKQHEISYFDRKQKHIVTSAYSITISWRWIIDNTTNLIILHDSLLPKYRGFAPLVNCLIQNEKRIGVTALFANEKYDCGDIIQCRSVEINYPIKIQQVIELITPLYFDLVSYITTMILEGDCIPAVKQIETDATYSLWRDEEDYIIDWNQSSEDILRFIDAVGSPYGGASTKVNDKKFRILDASIVADLSIVNRDVGKVLFLDKNKPVVVCKTGLLRIDKIVDDTTGDELISMVKVKTRFK